MARPHPSAARARVSRCLALITATVTLALAAAATAAADPGDVVWREVSQRASGGTDGYAALAVGPSGTVCAAGATSSSATAASDVLVRTYGAGGSLLWRRAWTWPGRSADTATAVVRDGKGAFVVAGSSGANWLLLKYSGGGYLQWVRRGHGSFARASLAAVAVDGSRNVYVAGTARPSGSGDRLLLRKYSAGGELRWQRTLASPDGDAAAVAMEIGGGDVYVAGTSATGDGTSSALTVKYSAGGALRWSREHAAGEGDAARATGLAYIGGPVICGWGVGPGGSEHGFVVRYDPGGAEVWTGTSGIAGVNGERFAGLATDGAGRVCVAGTADTVAGDAALVTSFDAGVQTWSALEPFAAGSAVCRSRDGFAAASGSAAFTVTRFAAGGGASWQRSVAPEGLADFRPSALQAAGDAYLYAVGSAAEAGGGRAAVIVRYRP